MKTFIGLQKAVFGMVHLKALPGTPYYDERGGISYIIEAAHNDAEALYKSGFDGFVFSNEGDRPYCTPVPPHTIGFMTRVIRDVVRDFDVPFGVSVLMDPLASISVAYAVGASFIRTFVTWAYVTDWGIVNSNPRELKLLQRHFAANDIKLLANLTGHSSPLAERDLVDLARGALFLAQVDAVGLAGVAAGSPVDMRDVERLVSSLPDTPVIVGTGVNIDNVADTIRLADGIIVGTSLKVDGDTFNKIDFQRARAFMVKVQQVRGDA